MLTGLKPFYKAVKLFITAVISAALWVKGVCWPQKYVIVDGSALDDSIVWLILSIPMHKQES